MELTSLKARAAALEEERKALQGELPRLAGEGNRAVPDGRPQMMGVQALYGGLTLLPYWSPDVCSPGLPCDLR